MDELTLRTMTRDEVDVLIGWAADEGWNPGLHDAEIFWQTDPEAFRAAELGGELIGGGAITSYGGRFGFMGLFIVRPEFRGNGYGRELWHARKILMRERLRLGAPIGMDGVFEMQDWYAQGGFVFWDHELRFESVGAETRRATGIVPLADVTFDKLFAYDRGCFPAPRETFLRAWIDQPDSLALGAVAHDSLTGYGVIRRCAVGAKIGPLFASDPRTAESLFEALAAFVPGEPVTIDIPERNDAAMVMARRRDMTESFGCVRMYLGPPPVIRQERIYGITTFELG